MQQETNNSTALLQKPGINPQHSKEVKKSKEKFKNTI